MKRPTMLTRQLLIEFGNQLGVSTNRDFQYIESRFEHEGLSFLTLTLPKLSEALEQGLASQRFSCPTNYRRHGSLPLLLGGFFNRVFDLDGYLLTDPCVECIYAIRQICRLFKKVKVPCSQKLNVKAVENYVNIEKELYNATGTIKGFDTGLDRLARVLWTSVFSEIDPSDIICRHGPGFTADRLTLNQRVTISGWPTRSEYSFPSDLHVFANYEHACSTGVEALREEGTRRFNELSLEEEEPVRIVLVPKDLRAPRVIALEPHYMQYMQQGVLSHMVTVLEEHELTRRSIRFSDQSHNREGARRASICGKFATIDLKDASDRVHFELVKRIFSGSGILNYLEDSRSLSALLPNGGTLILNKFASMGSALCFPVEACVFYTLIQTAMHYQDGINPSSRTIKDYSSLIDVYGDDIIIPVEYVDVVVQYFNRYSIRVNESKSFSEGNFRESCGGDYFKGIDVTPIYLRESPFSTKRRSRLEPNVLLSLISFSNQLYGKGLWSTAQYIRDYIVSQGYRIPTSQKDYGYPHYHSVCNTQFKTRYHNNQINNGMKVITFKPSKKHDPIADCMNSHLLFHLKPMEERANTTWHSIMYPDIVMRDHDKSTRRGSLMPKYRWISHIG